MSLVYINRAHEDWICDRLTDDFRTGNPDIVTNDPAMASTVWLLAGWAWKNLPSSLLHSRRVIVTVHHVVPEKFDAAKRADFVLRDSLVDEYHAMNERTADFIRTLTRKPVTTIPCWANQHIWTRVDATRDELREKYDIPVDAHVIGSFQRDTEGAGIAHGVLIPKLEKGPDLLVAYLKRLQAHDGDKLHIALAGWRREWVMQQLDAAGIAYTFFNRPRQSVVNELYQALDLYPVTSRHEGSPQALIECGLLGVPVVSRPVGIAELVLPEGAIADDVFDAAPSIPDVSSLMLPQGFDAYRKLLLGEKP